MLASVRATLVAIPLAAALAGCSGGPVARPPQPTTEQLNAMMERYAHSFDGRFGDDRVEFVRFPAAAEQEDVTARCLERFGVYATLTYFGHPDYESDPAVDVLPQGQRENAELRCSIMYPGPDVRAILRTPAQLEYLYNYNVNVLVPCLRSNGIEPGPTPTRARFLADGADFQPRSAYDGLMLADAPETAALLANCPAVPPGM